jgi:hypothetical protein
VTGKRARDLSILPEEILAATADIDLRVKNKPMLCVHIDDAATRILAGRSARRSLKSWRCKRSSSENLISDALADIRVLIAAVQFSVNLGSIRHKLSGVLHVGMSEESEVRGLFVRTMPVLVGSGLAILGSGVQMRRCVGVMADHLMRGHRRLLAT